MEGSGSIDWCKERDEGNRIWRVEINGQGKLECDGVQGKGEGNCGTS